MSRIISGVAVVLCLTGCGSHFSYVGTWTGKRKMGPDVGSTPDIYYTLSKVTLQVDEGGKYQLIDAGLPSKGHLSYKDKGADLVPNDVMGKPTEGQAPDTVKGFAATVTPQEDGTIVFKSGQGDAAVLTRQK